jgi:hypothetical protein
MTPPEPRLDMPLADLMSRALAGLYDGLMPGAWLEALIDRLEAGR